MLPLKHLAPDVLIAVNYCGRQLTHWMVWAAAAYHKKEGAIPHPRACKYILQYDWMPDGLFGVRVGA